MKKIIIAIISIILFSSCVDNTQINAPYTEYHVYDFTIPSVEGKFEVFWLSTWKNCNPMDPGCQTSGTKDLHEYYEFKLFRKNNLIKTYPLVECDTKIYDARCPENVIEKEFKYCEDYIIPTSYRKSYFINEKSVDEIYENECKNGIISQNLFSIAPDSE